METNILKKENLILYYNGDISLLDKKVIAVIGKREADEEVLNASYKVGKWLAQDGFVVLNGLALGCDKRAIEGALSENGKVIAVLPCGIDNIYPSSCKPLAKEIIDKGGLIISQFSANTPISKKNFIERDKTQAELSNKVISISCEEKSGTMHTLKYAHKVNKDIGCVLNSPGNEYALYKLNAQKIDSKKDIVEFAENGAYTQLSLFC